MCNCPKCQDKIDEKLFLEFLDVIRNNAPREEVDVVIEKIRNAKPKTILLEVPSKQIGKAIDILEETKFIGNYVEQMHKLRNILKEILNVKEEDL